MDVRMASGTRGSGPTARPCRATPNCPGLVLDDYCSVCGKRADSVAVEAPGVSATSGRTRDSAPGSSPSSPGSSPSARGSSPSDPGSRRGSVALTRASSLTRAAVTTSRRGSSRLRSGTPLVELPFMPPIDPTSAIMDSPIVPEDKRYCAGCDATIGRSLLGRPGRVVGYCSKCRTPFSFVPALASAWAGSTWLRTSGCRTAGSS